MRKAIAIDFDGCLCQDCYPSIGPPNWEVIRRAQAEQEHHRAIRAGRSGADSQFVDKDRGFL